MIRTLIIDDEPLAIEVVKGYILKTPFLELVGSFDDPIHAMSFLESNEVDLVFLDIQMPDITGLEFAKALNSSQKIIFTTAYEQYALKGIKLEALDYLLKPFGYEEFMLAAKKAKRNFELENKVKDIRIESNQGFLFLKSEYKIRRINYREILFIEGLKDYVKVYLENETKPILSLTSLKAIETKLATSNFMRVHRSYIVNLEKIQIIDRSRIVFNNHYIPVSDAYKENFQNFLDKNFL